MWVFSPSPHLPHRSDLHSKLRNLAEVCHIHFDYSHGCGVLGFPDDQCPAVDVDHFLLAREVIGALREAVFKEESPNEQGHNIRIADPIKEKTDAETI